MSRRLKPIKDLSVLILAPRKHDRQLWSDLLKNCGINNPISMGDLTHASRSIGSGQVDVVFVDEAYGPRGIANVLIPARNVEFAGGRGVCLILCSKKATAQDVLNARKLGFASLVILPASTDTVRKHLELAARYIPPSDEELGWSAPRIKEHRDRLAMPSAKEDPATDALSHPHKAQDDPARGDHASNEEQPANQLDTSEQLNAIQTQLVKTAKATGAPPSSQPSASDISGSQVSNPHPSAQPAQDSSLDEEPLEPLKAPGRTGSSANEEVVFL